MKLVSVIIPCYNVEKYIDKCVESLVNQTLGIENMELIFVNDASTDTTYDKLCKWEKKYPDSILVINCEENRRQGGARNIGLTYASADYIGYVDSDDWVETDMYEKMYEKAVSTGVDVVCVQYYRDDEYGNTLCVPYLGKETDTLCRIQKDGPPRMAGGIWSGLYLKNIIIENEIFFPEKLAYEDIFWIPLLIYYIKTYYVVGECLYHYNIHHSSTTHLKSSTQHLDILKVEKMLLEELKRRGFYEMNPYRIEFHFLKQYYILTMHLIFTRMNEIPYEIICEMQREVLKLIPDFEKNPFLNELDSMEQILLKTVRMKLSADDWEKIQLSYLEYEKRLND